MTIKVLHLGRIVGGVETSVLEICRAIDSTRFECLVATNETDTSYINDSGDDCKKYSIDFERSINPIKDIKAIVQLYKIIRVEKPQIIHCHSSKGGLIGRIVSLFFKVKVFYTPQAFSYLSTNSNLKRKFIIFYERALKPLTTVLLACSNSEAERARNEINYSSKKVIVWSNSITQIASTRSKLDQSLLINLGRPSFQKNTMLLVDVMHYIVHVKKKNLSLKIIGVGVHSPLKDEVSTQIKRLNLENNIELVDWADRSETLNTLSSALCYVSTSRYEGLPYAILEAMSLGIPTVATNSDGNRDCVFENETGFLIEEEIVSHFADRIIQLHENGDLREKMSMQSISRYKSDFDIRNTIPRLELIYETFANLRLAEAYSADYS